MTETPPSPQEDTEFIDKNQFEETLNGVISKFNLSPETDTEIKYKDIRKWAVAKLIRLIEVADYKVNVYCRPKSDKIQWARLVGYYLQILNTCLREQEVDEIKKRMEVIENVFIKRKG